MSTSLGGHGAELCSPASPSWNPEQDDAGHLLGKARPGVASYDSAGFLAWDPAGNTGTADSAGLVQDFSNMVVQTGEVGCPLSAPLEAWYRFLVDPDPPASVTKDPGSQSTTLNGLDNELLSERAAFLRPDSEVAIVMISDKDDCSVADTGLGWLVGYDATQIPSATAVCATDPNDKCCHSCGVADPAGCAHDPICDTQPNLPAAKDPPGLRCWDQKRRFGLAADPDHPEAGLLYPTQRYSNALEQTTLCPDHLDLACASGEQGVPNPLYSDLGGTGAVPRGPDLVFLAGVVGVPWQDIANNETTDEPDRLAYLGAADLEAAGRWHTIVGEPAKFEPPRDPLMVETPEVRTGKNPYTNAALAPPDAAPTANPINGHERSIPKQDDLQYACIFPLDSPKDCSNASAACDCGPGHDSDNPVCQDPNTGASSVATQFYGKAYPGLRELEVLREVGDNAMPASLCPKIVDPASPDYGFNPAMAAVTERLKSSFIGRCLPQPLDVDPVTGQVDCSIVEAIPGPQVGSFDCNQPGRTPLNDAKVKRDALAQLKSQGLCGVTGRPGCDSYLLCSVQQLDASQDAAAMSACENQASPDASVSGFCYTGDNASGQAIGNPDLVGKCPPAEHQLLRLVGRDAHAPLPQNGATYVLACHKPGC